MWQNIVIDDWILDENHFVSDNTYNIVMPNFVFLKGMTNNVGLPFSVGNTTSRLTVCIKLPQSNVAANDFMISTRYQNVVIHNFFIIN